MGQHKEHEKRKWYNENGEYIGVYETERGGVYMDKPVFFNRPEVIERINKLKNSKLVKDIRKRRNKKK